MTGDEWDEFQAWVRERRADGNTSPPPAWTRPHLDMKLRLIRIIKKHNVPTEGQPKWLRELNHARVPDPTAPPKAIKSKPVRKVS